MRPVVRTRGEQKALLAERPYGLVRRADSTERGKEQLDALLYLPVGIKDDLILGVVDEAHGQADFEFATPRLVQQPTPQPGPQQIGQDLRALRETLEVRGVSETEIQAVLRSELDGLVPRIADLTEGAVGRAVAGAEQVELRERISRHLRSYLRISRDLVDAFGLIDVSRTMSQANFLALYNAMAAYSDGYAELDEGLGEAPADVRRTWPGEAGPALARRLSEVLDAIHGDFHQTVLTLREPLLVIQAQHNGGHPDDDELRRATEGVLGALSDLEPVLARLEAEIPTMLESLRTP